MSANQESECRRDSSSSPAVVTSSASVPQGPGLGPIPMSQFGTISRQISRHSSSSASSASMVSATGTYRRAPSVSSQQPHINGGPAYTQNSGLPIRNTCLTRAVMVVFKQMRSVNLKWLLLICSCLKEKIQRIQFSFLSLRY